MKRFKTESLLRNSASLVGNLFLSTICGFGALTLLTHLFSVKAVGISTAAVSSCTLVEFLTQFGLSNSLPRFLPTAKNRATLLNTALTAVLLSTAVIGILFLALPYAKTFFTLGGYGFGVLFVVTACVLAAETMLATVLMADRASDRLAKASVIPNLVRLGSPLAFAFLGDLGAFIARVLADFAGCFSYAAVLIRRGDRFRPELNFRETREVTRFSGAMYVANVFGGLPQLLLPLIALSKVGAGNSAHWAVTMSIATILYQLPAAITQALLPEASQQSTGRRQLFLRAARLTTTLMLPVLAIAFFVAPIVLAIFGSSYAAGATGPLRWLVVANLISMLNWVAGAILVVAKKSMNITVVNVANTFVILGLVLVWARSVDQIAISWLFGDVVNTALFGLFAFLAVREVDWRWEYLGDATQERVPAAARQRPSGVAVNRTATGQMRALNAFITVAELQNAAAYYRPSPHLANSSPALFSVLAFEEAERQREQVKNSHLLAEHSAGADSAPDKAFDLLFGMAERQRAADGHDPWAGPE